MTIGNALTFIGRGIEEGALRERLNSATNIIERDQVLADETLLFAAHEFDEAYHHRLTQCQSAEAADQLKEFKMWWYMLTQILSPAACGQGCSGYG